MKIVFLDSATLGAVSLKPIEALGNLVCYPVSSPSEALERICDAEILIVNKIKVTAELIASAPKLKLICEAASGVNNIDVEAARGRDIPVMNVAAYSTDSVAQITFCQILGLLCDADRFDREVKDGSYSRSGIFTDVSSPYSELNGKTMGIIGMGNIGRRVARIAEAFGMKIVYYSTSGTSHCAEFPSLPLDELLSSADVVSVHCPLNEVTQGLIGERELGIMKSSAVIVNAARGGIIDEKALSDAVGSGKIAGAAVDVFTTEPLPADNPLLHCTRPERLRLTPHIAWASKEALDRLVRGIAENISNYLSCIPPGSLDD